MRNFFGVEFHKYWNDDAEDEQLVGAWVYLAIGAAVAVILAVGMLL